MQKQSDLPDTGGPAFPIIEPNHPTPIILHGLSVRDYFAAAALTGLLAKLPLIDQQGEHGKPVADKIAHNMEIAESCYWLADAMLKARASE